MIVKRILAELVDTVINVCLLVFEVLVILPIYASVNLPIILYVVVSIGTFYALIILVQGLFWGNGESIGKYFMRLEIIDATTEEFLPFTTIIAREFFVKYITFYFSSIPLLFGKSAIQDTVTNSMIRRKHVAVKV